MDFLTRRPRRNRKSQTIRNMIRETHLHKEDFIYPLFIIEGEKQKIEIQSMPGQYRFSLDFLQKEIDVCMEMGLRAFALFPVLKDAHKKPLAEESYNPEGFYLQAIRTLKTQFSEACFMTDVAMDPYSSDGHDGVYKNSEILNDETLPILARMAVAQAQAGADILGPSDMMDGRVGFIRRALDEMGFTNVSIMSYTAKYASQFYGPFREALDSAPRSGDKKTYQLDPANRREAQLEAELDTLEGADFLMVKPALAYLDVISDLRQTSNLPIAAYNVSGEYAMVKAVSQMGWLKGEAVMLEMLTSIKRAGASVILTYFAKEAAQLL